MEWPGKERKASLQYNCSEGAMVHSGWRGP